MEAGYSDEVIALLALMLITGNSGAGMAVFSVLFPQAKTKSEVKLRISSLIMILNYLMALSEIE